MSIAASCWVCYYSNRGAAPITKNGRTLSKTEYESNKGEDTHDEFDNRIGLTYPKRAQGLIKHGRAEYVSDDRIRLLKGAHAPSANNDTEDIKMSNIINFNAQEFKFDESCQSMDDTPVNAGSRMFISDFKGDNVQVFEIGDWNWTWSQIKCDKQLEPNTDYVFRFAVQGGVNNTGDGQSHFMVIHDKDWDNKLEYPLERSRFKPSLSKKSEDGFLRVYEIPFNSGSGNVRFVFTALHFVETIMPAYELEAYAGLEDQTYDQLWQEIQERGNGNNFHGNWNRGALDLSGAVINSSRLIKKFMKMAERGIAVDLSGAVLGGDDADHDDEFFWEYDRKAAEVDAKWERSYGTYEEVRETLKRAYADTEWLYKSAPEGSPEKNALRASLDGMKASLDGLADTFE